MKKFLALILSAFMSVTSVGVINAQENENVNVEANVETSDEITPLVANIPAFPGAEGGGKYATGGRGGKIYYVTNLNDSGAGSFRDAVSGSNRIVLFKVGGTIELKSDVVVKGNVTIAGQTAPGGQGITLKNYKLGLGGSNIICRFISSRPGEVGKENDGFGGSDGSNSIVDHCSIGWANDEMFGLYSNNDKNTVQWSVIGPSNSWSVHDKGLHGFGIMFGKSNNTWHHNLIAHNISRNFRGKVEGTSTAEFVNNVIYNWGYQTGYGTLGHLNYVNNYLKAGQSTTSGYHFLSVPNSGSNPWKYKIYLQGNKIEKQDGSIYVSDSTDENWSKGMSLGTGPKSQEESTAGTKSQYTRADLESSVPFKITVGSEDLAYASKAESADKAFGNVTKFAGSGISTDKRTEIDKQVANETITGTGYLTGARAYSEASSSIQADIDKYKIQCSTVYNYPAPITTGAYADSDGDGMEDSWEAERGLNPYSKYDENGNLEANQDYCGQGYTNIEYYINDLTVDAFPEGVVTVSPTTYCKLIVDGSADEKEGESYKTFAKAFEYMKTRADLTKAVIEVADGIYNENVVIDISNVAINAKGNNALVDSITVAENANDFAISGVAVNSYISNGDKNVAENVIVNNNISLNARAYIKNSTINCAVKATGNAVIDGSKINSDYACENSGTVLFNNCNIAKENTKIVKALSATSKTFFYNCTFNKSASGNDRVENDVNALVVECNSKDSNAINYAQSEKTLSETKFLLDYLPYNVLKGTDSWNPANFSETTPQEDLKATADKITVSTGIISKETALPTEKDGATLKWTCDTEGILNGNIITIGAYGDGIKEATLTVTVSKDGLSDEIRTFEILIGSSANSDFSLTFEDEETGSVPSYFDVSTADYKKGTDFQKANLNGKINWYVADKINNETQENGKFFCVDQTKATLLDETLHTNKGIHDFTYDFGDQSEAVIEMGFDFYTEEISPSSFFEAYAKSSKANGSKTIGQLRFKNESESYMITGWTAASTTSDFVTDNADGKWYKAKMIVDTRGITSGTAPTIDYYIYDSTGKEIGKLLNNSPRVAYDANNYAQSIPSVLTFRPNRNLDVCKFYVDNIYMKNISETAKKEIENINLEEVYDATQNAKLPKYGSFESPLSWAVIEGDPSIINADGTINYDKVKDAVIKVRATVDAGSVSISSDVYTIRVLGTADKNAEYTDTRFFEETESFNNWSSQLGQSEFITLNDTSSVGGNNTSKIKLANKAVFKSFKNAISYGKVKFETDFFTDTDGRTMRIYFENAPTKSSSGEATEEFASTNIIYHLMNDTGNNITVQTTDVPTARDGGTVVCKADPNKWYKAEITVDFEKGTSNTAIYSYGTYGDSSTLALEGEKETALVSKSPLEIEQIRLVRTAAGNVYFDNIKLMNLETSPSETFIYGDVDNDGRVTANDAALTLAYVRNKDLDLTAEQKKAMLLKDDNTLITATNAAKILKKAKNSAYEF